MKRKKISLACAMLSLIIAVVYFSLALVLVVRAAGAKEYLPTAESNIWIVQVLKRLKQTSFNLFFSIMGIALTLVLAIYRLTLAYFYNQVSKSDDTFYKARLGEIVLFSVLSGFVIGATAWLIFGIKSALPVEVQPFILILFIGYIVLCALPLLEVLIMYLAKLKPAKSTQAIPTKVGVVNELDNLADETALKMVKRQDEKPAEGTPSADAKAQPKQEQKQDQSEKP